MSLGFTENDEGYLIPYDEQRPLAAQDPWAEAEQWSRDLFVPDSEALVVGLGAGFHVAQLARQKSLNKIFVIDSRPGLVNLFRKQFPELNHIVEVIIVENTEALLAHEIMNEVMEKNLSAFAFTPCWPKSQTQFSSFHRHLSGRSRESLDLFMKKHGVRKDIQFVDESGHRYLTIKDLELLIQEDVPPFLRLNCFRILRELIL